MVLVFSSVLFDVLAQELITGNIDDKGRINFKSKIITLPDSSDKVIRNVLKKGLDSEYKLEVKEEKSIQLKVYRFNVIVTHNIQRSGNKLVTYTLYSLYGGNDSQGRILKKDSIKTFFDESTELKVYKDLADEQLKFVRKTYSIDHSFNNLLSNLAYVYFVNYDFASKVKTDVRFNDTLMQIPAKGIRKLIPAQFDLFKATIIDLKNQLPNNDPTFTESQVFLLADEKNNYLGKIDFSEKGYYSIRLKKYRYFEYGKMHNMKTKLESILNK